MSEESQNHDAEVRKAIFERNCSKDKDLHIKERKLPVDASNQGFLIKVEGHER